MDELLAGLRAIAETTRLRIVFVLSHGEFNVSELTQILGQSQPRISRHLKLMTESGLLSRHKEGSWVLFRLRDEGAGGALRANHCRAAAGWRFDPFRRCRPLGGGAAGPGRACRCLFSASMPPTGNNLRSLHVREEEVEAAMQRLAGRGPLGTSSRPRHRHGARPATLRPPDSAGRRRRFRAARCWRSPAPRSRMRACATCRCAMATSLRCLSPMTVPISSPSTRCFTISTSRAAPSPRQRAS